MLTGLYSAASGMIIQEKYQDLLAQNLANSSQPGFAREEMVIRSFPDVMLSETYNGIGRANDNPRYNHAIGRIGTGAGVDWHYTNHDQGQMQHTDIPTDFALFGDGFFTVQTPDGMRYTRGGDFHINSEGYLVNSQGYHVMGHGVNNGRQPAPINIGNRDFNVNMIGEIFVQQPDANGIMQNQLLDQLKVTDFHNKDKLFRQEGNLYRVEEGDEDNFKIPGENFRVAQGYLERSNSLPTVEMVKMMDSFRIHEASARVIRSLDQTLQKAVNEVGRPF